MTDVDVPNIPPVLSTGEAEKRISQVEGADLALLLLEIQKLDDWRWVQNTYLEFTESEDLWVATAAVVGLADLVKTSGDLDVDIVVPQLSKTASRRPELSGVVENTMTEIESFLLDHLPAIQLKCCR